MSLTPATRLKQRGRLRILIAEDHPTNQFVAKQILQELGCHAHMVGDGQEAIDALRHGSYDLLLMDCQMPQVDGMEATRRIRGGELGPQTAHIPIIALTANALPGDRERCLAAGMSDYVSKPFRLTELSKLLDRWASRLLPAPDSPTVASQPLEPAVSARLTTPPTAASGNEGASRRLIHDRARFTWHTRADPEWEGRITAVFLADMPKLVAALNATVHAGNYRRASSLAKRVRGAAKGLAANRLEYAAAELEGAAMLENPSRMRELLELLESELNFLTVALSSPDTSPPNRQHPPGAKPENSCEIPALSDL
jgi:CheY-like chemotaxis protein